MMIGETAFIAEVRFKTTEEGGRQHYASSGYRPQIKFPFSEKSTSGEHTFLNSDKVNPGETAIASIKLLSPHFFEKALEEGMEFEIIEGWKICGTGKLIKILNPNLIKP
jgi:translation elongation factor EF-Tu-like GTPase